MNSLLVGVGISDRAAPGDDPVADAVTAEALGYDFVSAFDHPVSDTFTAQAVGYDVVSAVGHPVRTYPTYETQTLLTWIAARTTRIGIVTRVLGGRSGDPPWSPKPPNPCNGSRAAGSSWGWAPATAMRRSGPSAARIRRRGLRLTAWRMRSRSYVPRGLRGLSATTAGSTRSTISIWSRSRPRRSRSG